MYHGCNVLTWVILFACHPQPHGSTAHATPPCFPSQQSSSQAPPFRICSLSQDCLSFAWALPGSDHWITSLFLPFGPRLLDCVLDLSSALTQPWPLLPDQRTKSAPLLNHSLSQPKSHNLITWICRVPLTSSRRFVTNISSHTKSCVMNSHLCSAPQCAQHPSIPPASSFSIKLFNLLCVWLLFWILTQNLSLATPVTPLAKKAYLHPWWVMRYSANMVDGQNLFLSLLWVQTRAVG